MMLATSLVLVNGCSRKNDDHKKKIIEVLAETKNTTYFDEIMSEERIYEIYSIEQYLELSEELHDLKFERLENFTLGEQSLLNPDEVRGKIYLYGKKKELSDRDFNELQQTLTIQEKLVNRYIYNSYGTMEAAALVGLKTELLTIKGLDETFYDAIIIPDSNDSQLNDAESAYVYLDEYRAKRSLGIAKLLESVYEMQQKGDSATHVISDKESYNSDRNQFIREAITNLKTVLTENYESNKRNILKKIR